MTVLDEKLEQLARVPILLVASDYDGTLAPIVSDPTQARPHREGVVALRNLSGLPQTHVAVISGRSLRDLDRLTNLPSEVHLVGSHGSEFDPDFAQNLSRDALQLRDRVLKDLRAIADRDEGFAIEEKPASVAFHYRNATDGTADKAVKDVLAGPAAIDGVYTKHGKKVIELAVVSTSKGNALESVRHRVGATAVLFLGDDVTDEDAFATLKGPDVGIKIGDGDTRAAHRLRDPQDVARVLAKVSELRSEWLAGSDSTPIEQHSILTDHRTIALLKPNADVTWLCLPRLDSGAVFADLLGGPTAGFFRITPLDDDIKPIQRYLDDSFVLETKWQHITLTDFLDISNGRSTQRPGRSELIRILEGKGRVRIEFAPRLDFGRVPTRMNIHDDGLQIEDTHDPIILRAPGIEWQITEEGKHHTATAEVDLDNNSVELEMRYGTGSLRPSALSTEDRLKQTTQHFQSWALRLHLPGVEPELVRRSALALKALCYGPRGSIAAAATTSLPEHVGGVRNWDYRFCWIRDAAMTATSLVKLGSITEAMEYLDWFSAVVDACESPDRVQPLYTLTGEELTPEAEISELAGYRGSRPVRVGNAASRQVQLDVFGPVADLLAELAHRDAPLSSVHWRIVEAMVNAVEKRWQEPDHGIWEIRAPVRQHVHSKVMCWVTVDRAIDLAEHFFDRDAPKWRTLRDTIAADVLEYGYNENAQAFTTAYGFEDLDAAALSIGLSGLIKPTDDRFVSTVEAVNRDLRNGPTVYRYRCDDGLPGYEGGFHLCASWLVDSFLLIGREHDARELFQQIVSLCGPTGLLSEQYGPNTKRALGNFPQAYSHIGLIDNAINLARH